MMKKGEKDMIESIITLILITGSTVYIIGAVVNAISLISGSEYYNHQRGVGWIIKRCIIPTLSELTLILGVPFALWIAHMENFF